MIKCLNCNQDFNKKSKKSIFCSNKCRLYSFREKNRIKTNEWKYIQDSDGKNYALDKSLVFKLAIFFGLDVRVPKKEKLAENKPKIDAVKKTKSIAVKNTETIVKPIVEKQIESLQTPIKKEVDYAKEFSQCEFPDEYKTLWDKINADDSVTTLQKKYWKIELGIK